MTAPANSSILTKVFYPSITLFSFFTSFFPFIVDSCNYGSFFRKGIKMKFFTFYNNLSKN